MGAPDPSRSVSPLPFSLWEKGLRDKGRLGAKIGRRWWGTSLAAIVVVVLGGGPGLAGAVPPAVPKAPKAPMQRPQADAPKALPPALIEHRFDVPPSPPLKPPGVAFFVEDRPCPSNGLPPPEAREPKPEVTGIDASDRLFRSALNAGMAAFRYCLKGGADPGLGFAAAWEIFRERHAVRGEVDMGRVVPVVIGAATARFPERYRRIRAELRPRAVALVANQLGGSELATVDTHLLVLKGTLDERGYSGLSEPAEGALAAHRRAHPKLSIHPVSMPGVDGDLCEVPPGARNPGSPDPCVWPATLHGWLTTFLKRMATDEMRLPD